MQQMHPDHGWLMAAQDLASYLRAGNSPPAVRSLVRLDQGEHLVAELVVDGLHYLGHERAEYTHSNFLMLGSAAQAVASLGASAAWNAFKRKQAMDVAAPQWRPLGLLEVKVTSHRLLTVVDGQFVSLYYGGIRQIVPDLHGGTVELRFDERPPLLFRGPPAGVLAVYLVYFLYGQVLDTPAYRPPVPLPPPPQGSASASRHAYGL